MTTTSKHKEIIRAKLSEFASQENGLKSIKNAYFKKLSAENYEIYKKLSVTDLHVLNDLSDKVFLAKHLVTLLPVTQSAISKSIARLVKHNLIQITQKKGNKKERIISRTSSGEEISQVYNDYRETVNLRFEKITSQFTQNELTTIEHFLTVLNNELY